MNILEAISTRRSVRSFTDTPIPVDKIQQILAYAAFAPSSGDSQPWEVIIVDDKNTLAQAARFNPYADFSGKAPLGLVVCGNRNHERFPGFWVQDCAAYTQNMLLAAHDQGLGTLWTGIYPAADRVRKFSALLAIPSNISPMALVLIGYSDRKMPMPMRTMEGKIHYNRHGVSTGPRGPNFNNCTSIDPTKTTLNFLKDTRPGR